MQKCAKVRRDCAASASIPLSPSGTLLHMPYLLANQLSWRYTPNVLLLGGALLLASDPLVWLVGTWFAPGYDSFGLVTCVLVVGLFTLSVASGFADPQRKHVNPESTGIWWLLLATAALRGLSQLLDVNVLGALLLCVDVFALARLAQLSQRRIAVSGFWLAVLFCFCLPIEPIVQRLLGFGLQQLSAQVACVMLQPWFASLQCDGVRLVLDGKDVLIDLPCSGAQLLSITAMLLTLILSLRPVRGQILAGLMVLWFVASIFANGLRIAVLAVGIALPLGVNVMAPLPHTLIGLCSVLLVGGLLIASVLRYAPLTRACFVTRHRSSRALRLPLWAQQGAAMSFLSFALLIGALQPQPVDASPPSAPPEVPLVAADFLAQELPLTDQEQRYFTQFGGGARRAGYGPFGLLLVSTASPLRHLHDPAVCWRGMGFTVHRVGTDFQQGATIYRAVAKQQSGSPSYELRVSFIDDQGVRAHSIAEVVWHWISNPTRQWTMVQRILPEAQVRQAQAERWDLAMVRAFNL